MTETLVISSLQNATVRNIVRLRDNRQRQREHVVIVDGVSEIQRAINAGLAIQSVFVSVKSNLATESLVQQVPKSVVRVTEPVLSKIAFGQHHRDAVALFEEPRRSLQDLRLGVMPVIVVLDGIEKPGNVGAVFRSADAIGADAVVICEGGCDLFNPSVIRASLGTIFAVPAAQANRTDTIAWLRQHECKIVSARVDAKSCYWDIDYRQSIAIVIGSEANGLGEQWRRSDLESSLSIDVCIPMRGSADSLNASVSAALLMFEAQRQRLR